MNNTAFNSANANKQNRSLITDALASLPALTGGATITAEQFYKLIYQVDASFKQATDSRLSDSLTTVSTAAYSSLRSALSTLAGTFDTEFDAL